MSLQWARRIASYAAAGSAILYFSIGFGFVSIGSRMDLLGMCLAVGFGLLVASVFLPDVRSRVFAAGMALAVMVLIAGYLATVTTRTPAFEFWGLSLQAVQVALVVALAWLAFAPPPARDTTKPPSDVLTWKASSA